MLNKRKKQKATKLDFGRDIFNAFRDAFQEQFPGLQFWFSSYITWNPIQTKDVPPEVLKAYQEDSHNIEI